MDKLSLFLHNQTIQMVEPRGVSKLLGKLNKTLVAIEVLYLHDHIHVNIITILSTQVMVLEEQILKQ